MGMPLGMQAIGTTGLFQQADKPLFQNTGTDAAQHIVAGLAFQDDAVDAARRQKLRQQQTRRPAADDGHLRFHLGSPLPGPFSHVDLGMKNEDLWI